MKFIAAVSFLLPLAAAISLPAALQKRTRSCSITSPSGANCRATPSTKATIKHTLVYGDYYNFYCRETGDSVSGDPYWDFNTDYDCYVWEGLTDDNCAPSALPYCPTPCTRDLEDRRVC